MNAVDARRLVGGWRYVRWDILYPDGRITHPYGAEATGCILYTEDGWMSANIMAANRVQFSSGNPRKADDTTRARAFDSYFSYAGRWRFEGGKVVHDVEVALNPAFVGVRQLREPKLESLADGSVQLTLSAREEVAEGVRLHRILWSRSADMVR